MAFRAPSSCRRDCRWRCGGGQRLRAGAIDARHVIKRPHRVRRFAGRAWPFRDLHDAVRPAHFREIGREPLLVHLNDRLRRTVRHARSSAADRFHQIDDSRPALFVETELQRIARRMAAIALVVQDLLHVTSSALSSGSDAITSSPGSCRHFVSGSVIVFSVRSWRLLADRSTCGLRLLEAERLRPDAIFARRHRRENNNCLRHRYRRWS